MRRGSISNFEFLISNAKRAASTKPHIRRGGFALVEILVDFFILTMVVVAVLGAYSASTRTIELAKAKIAAVALANEKMEELRNMPYDSLATEHGPIYPPGDLLDSETITRKGIVFTATTTIAYVDDPFDGNSSGSIVGKPTDIYPYDYKKAEVIVTKQGRNGILAKVSSQISARAAETPTSSGIIRVCVVDSAQTPLSEATLTITNSEVSPPVNIIVQTGLDGCSMIPSLPPSSHNNYHLAVTKEGYSTESTYPRTAQNPNALHPDVDVILQQVTNQTFSIDQLSTMTIQVVDTAGNPVANTGVHVQGTKLIYNNPDTPKYSQDFTTDANGQIALTDMEFDGYAITVSGWIVVATSPYQPVSLLAGEDKPVQVVVTHDSGFPIITSAEPLASVVGEHVVLTLRGQNFIDGLTMRLVRSGTEITGTGIVVSKHAGTDVVDAEFDLVGAAQGFWDIVLTNPDGKSITEKNGFEVR